MRLSFFFFLNPHTFTNEHNKNISCVNEIYVSGQCSTFTNEGCSVSNLICNESSQTFENTTCAMRPLVTSLRREI